MKKREKVSAIMSSSVFTVDARNDIQDVCRLFDRNGIHHVPVVSGDKLVGIISKSDIDKISFVTDYAEGSAATQVYTALTIDQVMTKDVTTVQADDEIRVAAEKLATGDFHAVPVLDGDQVVGILTSTDLIKFLVDLY